MYNLRKFLLPFFNNKTKVIPYKKQKPRLLLPPPISQKTKNNFPISSDAFHGPIGEIVENIFPHTEASKESLLIQLLASLGNIIGRSAYYRVESTNLYPNIFCVLVGESSWARKGTSWNHIHNLLQLPQQKSWSQEIVSSDWLKENIRSGLSTGEGILHRLREEASDKRLLIIESEFASFLRKINREGNILSQVMRDAWDSKDLSILTKSNPIHVTNPHISFIGHITHYELKKALKDVEIFNGLANRILWIYSQRSKILPFGGSLDSNIFKNSTTKLSYRLKGKGQIQLSHSCRNTWEDYYNELNTPGPLEYLNSIIARAPAQILKLALIYCLCDGEREIKPVHLKAAKALWDYSANSINKIFLDKSLDPKITKILKFLAIEKKATRTDLRDLFGRHIKSSELDNFKEVLTRIDKISIERHGKTEIWYLK